LERENSLLVRVDENAGDEVLALLADGERTVDVAALDALEHLLDDLGLAGGVLAHHEEQALDDDGDADERQQQNRPHDFLAVDEEIHGRHIAAVFIFQEEREGGEVGDHKREVGNSVLVLG
jgi:hypothetical protein